MAVLDVAPDVLRDETVGEHDSRHHSALVVVDMQQDYARVCASVVGPVVALARSWSDRGQLVFLTKRLSRGLRVDDGEELVGDLEELSGYLVHILERNCWSVLNDELATYLGLYGVEAVKVCGIDTERSVLASAVSLFDAGFETTVLGALCASSEGPKMHRNGLSVLARILGSQRVVDGEEGTRPRP
jgi:nicotinamidase-related amidase